MYNDETVVWINTFYILYLNIKYVKYVYVRHLVPLFPTRFSVLLLVQFTIASSQLTFTSRTFSFTHTQANAYSNNAPDKVLQQQHNYKIVQSQKRRLRQRGSIFIFNRPFGAVVSPRVRRPRQP